MAGFNRNCRFIRRKDFVRLPKGEPCGCNDLEPRIKRKTSMKHTRLLLLIALLSVGAVGLPSLRGATLTVTNTNDSGPGSLRQALADAHNEDVINFDPSLNGQTITLTSGELVVNKIVSIYSPDPNNLAIDANHASRT